jgi:hypothetical protein
MRSTVGNILCVQLIPAVNESLQAQLFQITDVPFIFKKYCWYNEIFKLHLVVKGKGNPVTGPGGPIGCMEV